MVILKVLCLVLSLTVSTQCANILYVVPFTSTSHYIMLRSIGLELARRGHNVTVITANKEKNPPDNYREVMVDDKKIWEVIGGGRPNVFSMASISAEKFHEKILWAGGLAFTEVIMNSVQVQQFLASDQKFDLVICEQFFQEATYILAHKYKAPLVLVTTFGNCRRHNIIARNPLQFSTVIPEFLDIKDPMSFWGRLRNLYFTMYEFVWWKFWYLRQQEHLVEKYVSNLTEPVPSLYEMQNKASLMFVNSHFSFDGPTAYLPNIVEIGGIHLEKSDGELPKDLKELLDQSKEGVIYMNFGSNVRSSELPLEKKTSFINVFRRLNQTVVWKWEDDNLVTKPNNVYVRSWLPQKDIFAHPNVKLFISHGGLIGTQEAIFHGIPIIGIPIYADQYNNLLQVQEKGFGKILQFDDINESYLDALITEVLNNDTYKKNAVDMSRKFKDRPMSALDTAMFWIEYVIRNNVGEPLKNPALELSWISYLMIDVYLFILLVVILCAYVCVKSVYIIKLLLFNEIISKDKKNN